MLLQPPVTTSTAGRTAGARAEAIRTTAPAVAASVSSRERDCIADDVAQVPGSLEHGPLDGRAIASREDGRDEVGNNFCVVRVRERVAEIGRASCRERV